MSEIVQKGTLYIVSTPIGNLEDISIRAVYVLSNVDLIAAEDTRKTKILLTHYNIDKPITSYFSYNEVRRIPEFITKLKSGLAIGLVSDAGTPGISDPAYRIVRAALYEELPVIAIPGPTAFLPALITSGLSSDRFLFLGFIPTKKGRQTLLKELRHEKKTIIVYEAPHRLIRTLSDLMEFLGNRNISVSRELTKKFEETFRGKISEAISHFDTNQPRGEFVLIIEGHNPYKLRKSYD